MWEHSRTVSRTGTGKPLGQMDPLIKEIGKTEFSTELVQRCMRTKARILVSSMNLYAKAVEPITGMTVQDMKAATSRENKMVRAGSLDRMELKWVVSFEKTNDRESVIMRCKILATECLACFKRMTLMAWYFPLTVKTINSTLTTESFGMENRMVSACSRTKTGQSMKVLSRQG